MKDLLICISHHSAPGRLDFLRQTLLAFKDYQEELDIIIDTNAVGLMIPDLLWDDISIVSHVSLAHPFHLTWQHRRHFKDRLDQYSYFLYLEDDIRLNYPNYLRYLANFTQLWPNYVPSFVRIEELNGIKMALDVTRPQICQPIEVAGRLFCALQQPYHGFWLMPRAELAASMSDAFTRVSDSRETAASFPMWELGKTPLVQIEQVDGRYQIHPECWAFHLPNNYSREPSSPHGKIPVKEIFVK